MNGTPEAAGAGMRAPVVNAWVMLFDIRLEIAIAQRSKATR